MKNHYNILMRINQIPTPERIKCEKCVYSYNKGNGTLNFNICFLAVKSNKSLQKLYE